MNVKQSNFENSTFSELDFPETIKIKVELENQQRIEDNSHFNYDTSDFKEIKVETIDDEKLISNEDHHQCIGSGSPVQTKVEIKEEISENEIEYIYQTTQVIPTDRETELSPHDQSDQEPNSLQLKQENETYSDYQLINHLPPEESSRLDHRLDLPQLTTYHCDLCSFSAKNEDNLKHHKDIIHLKLLTITKCKHCSYCTTNEKFLKQHVEKVHIHSKKFHCNNCDFMATRKLNLIKHIEKEHLQLESTNSYFCHLCDYSTTECGNLKRHKESIHLKLKDKKCDLCSYVTTLKGNLRQHINTVHGNISKIRRYKCVSCDFRSARQRDLNRHMMVHLQKKYLECPSCDYSTTRKDHLNLHRNAVHLQKKTKVCDLCDFKSTQKSDVTRHKKTVHLNLKRKCHFCEFECKSAISMKRHTDKVHNTHSV